MKAQWAVVKSVTAGRGFAWKRPYILSRLVDGCTEHYAPNGRLARFQSAEAAAKRCELINRLEAGSDPAMRPHGKTTD